MCVAFASLRLVLLNWCSEIYSDFAMEIVLKDYEETVHRAGFSLKTSCWRKLCKSLEASSKIAKYPYFEYCTRRRSIETSPNNNFPTVVNGKFLFFVR